MQLFIDQYKKTILLITVFTLFQFHLGATVVDSLENKLLTANKPNKILILLQLCEIQKDTAIYKLNLYAGDAMDYAQTLNDSIAYSQACFYMGLYFQSVHKNFDATYYFQKSIKQLSKLEGNFGEKAVIYDQLAHFNYINNNYKQSINYNYLAQINAEFAMDSALLSRIFDRYGDIHYKLENYDKALDYDFKSYNISLKLNDSLQIASLQLKIGNIYWRLNNFDPALEYLAAALEISQNADYKEITASTYNSLGNVYEEQHKIDQALQQYYLALEDSVHLRGTEILANTVMNIGRIYYQRRNYDHALSSYQKAYQYFKNLDDQSGMGLIFNNLGKIYIEKKDFGKADQNLNLCLKIAEKIGSKDLKMKAYFSLYELKKKQNNSNLAREYFLLYSEIKDTLNIENLSLRTSEIQSKYDIDRLENEIKLLSKDKILQEMQLRRQEIIILLFICVIIIVIIFVVILYKQNKQKKKTNRQLASQTKEIASAQEQLHAANNELKINEHRFRLVVQYLPVMIIAMDKSGKIVFWNNECTKITGYLADEILHHANPEILLIGSEGGANKKKQSFMEWNDFSEKEIEFICKDGTRRIIALINVSNAVSIPEWGKWLVGLDITDRHKFQHSLTQEKALLNSIINTIPDLIFYKAIDSKYLGTNPSFSDFYEIDNNKFIGKTASEIFDEELAERINTTDNTIFKTGKTWYFENWETGKEGEQKFLATTKKPFYDEDGNMLGIVGISRDLTERHRFEEALHKAKEKAEESDRQKSTFLANMSHDIRTPVNAIVGFTELLSITELAEDKKLTYIDYIQNSANNLLNLIDDIIDVAKIEAGEIKIKKTYCPVNNILKELFAAYEQLKVKNRKSHLKLLLKFENENEDHVIFSDPFRFRQIINNLISNALKFTDKGVIEFGYEKENINDKPFLKFYVMDTGIGIPASQLKLIFDRFGQVEDTLVRNLKGTGLGLNISKNLVEILGGKIWVESREKMGSVFYFTLPDEPPPLEKREQLIIPRKGKYNWNSKTILVAEDDKMNFNLLNIILQQAHANVLWAKTGQQAIDMFFDNKDIGLILMDIQMPEKNGYDATREIRKTDKKIPIIAQTAFAMSGEAEKSKEAGCNHYLKKPLNQDELLAIINKYLG